MHSKLSITAIALLTVFVTSMLFVPAGVAHKSPAQDPEKALDIKRYLNEPLGLVDLKVSEQSVKGNIQVKRRINGEGLDSVKFQDKDEWFRRVKVRLRNVSDKPILNIVAYLYFKPPSSIPLYSVELTPSRSLHHEALQPGEEIDLTVTEQSWNRTAKILQQFGVDANTATVSFSVDFVVFNNETLWHKGHLVHQDPNDPLRWIPIN
jgi:hypothetical protein